MGTIAAQEWLPHVIRPESVIVVAMAGVLTGAAVWLVETDWTTAIRSSLLFALIYAVTVVYRSTHLIPNSLLLSGLAMAAIALSPLQEDIAPFLVASATCGFGLLIADNLWADGEAGKGIVKLGAVIGLFMGWPAGPMALLLLAPAVFLQWLITRAGWIEPAWQIMLMGFGLMAFYLAHRLTGSR